MYATTHIAIMELTEISVFCHLDKPPKTSIHHLVPFMVNPTTNERIVSRHVNVDTIPDWVVHPKSSNVRFQYNIKNTSGLHLQVVECSYNVSTNVLACIGIQLRNKDAFLNCIDELLCIVGSKPTKEQDILYKARGFINISRPWDRDLFAYIVTTDPRLWDSMSINELSCTLSDKKLLPVLINVTQNQSLIGLNDIRAVVNISDTADHIVLKLSKLPGPDIGHMVMSLFQRALDIYECTYDNVVSDRLEPYAPDAAPDDNRAAIGISALRRALPELFINNYTRECPILPLMVPSDLAFTLKDAIFYPKQDAKYGRYYVAPKGYFVGLKQNRLRNKHIFPYLVTCYMSNHMKRPNSDTYNYFINNADTIRPKRNYMENRMIPRSLIGMDQWYTRVGAGIHPGSFITALERATCTVVDRASLAWAPHLVKQELWETDDEEIMNTLRDNTAYISGSLMFRLFEELLGICIHVIKVNNGCFEILPRHVHPYVWYPPFNEHSAHVVIFENIKTTYGNKRRFHEVLMRRSDQCMRFQSDDKIVASIIEKKHALSVRPDKHLASVAQLLDEHGKCRILKVDDTLLPTFDRPLTVPIMEAPVCFYNTHMRKMNDIKARMGIPQVDLSKLSTRHVIYFPNDASFRAWIHRESTNST